ncbi:hypothetical protein [Sinorhizobium medicae]|uniref:hypothetical protein n=1 Tax=Sinorhizobium medicae TaxID=110321 RepID=UPI001F38DB99|nr:hypothetical protein [Sinorhizobium medicae]
MTRCRGILELALEEDPSRSIGERCENLSRTGNEPMQFEGEEGPLIRPTSLLLWQADPGQEILEPRPGGLDVNTAVD